MTTKNPPLRGQPILCTRCGKAGGTLVKQDDDKYVHKQCPPNIAILRKEDKDNVP